MPTAQNDLCTTLIDQLFLRRPLVAVLQPVQGVKILPSGFAFEQALCPSALVYFSRESECGTVFQSR